MEIKELPPSSPAAVVWEGRERNGNGAAVDADDTSHARAALARLETRDPELEERFPELPGVGVTGGFNAPRELQPF